MADRRHPRQLTRGIFGLLALFVLALGAGCDDSPKKLEAAQARLLEFVKITLLDPDSAKFKTVVVRKVSQDGQSGFEACGQVNAKNRFGGYTGFDYFYVSQIGDQAPRVLFARASVDEYDVLRAARILRCAD